MDVKQEPVEPLKEIIKIEPDLCVQTEENYYKLPGIPINDHGVVLDAKDPNELESNTMGQFFSNTGIKQEIAESEVFKGEQYNSDMPTNIDCGTVFENVQISPAIIIKQELENACDYKVTNTDITYIKQEISDYNVDPKTESELNSHCDLPTLKNEIDYPEYYSQPCSSKQIEGILPLKNTDKAVSKNRNKRYPCPVCQKNFPSSKSRSNHIDLHFGKSRKAYFRSSKSRSKKNKRHYGKRFVACEFCGTFINRIECFQHYFIHLVKSRTKKVTHKIKIETVCINNIELKNENDNSSYSELNTELNNKNLDDNLFKCEVCSKTFKHKSSLRNHSMIHDNKKELKCNICFKTFNYKMSFNRHLMIHTNKRQFKCDICSKTFNLKAYLNRHLVTHNPEIFKCDICSKEFNRRCLEQHLLVHTNERSYKCDICSKKFKQLSSLKNHKIIHSNEKPFKCTVCSKGFNQKSTLRHHVVLHNNKRFKCHQCSKEFHLKSGLQRHLVVHSDEKPFKCEICSKECKLKANFKKHLKTHDLTQ